jgi:hypothetical protein
VLLTAPRSWGLKSVMAKLNTEATQRQCLNQVFADSGAFIAPASLAKQEGFVRQELAKLSAILGCDTGNADESFDASLQKVQSAIALDNKLKAQVEERDPTCLERLNETLGYIRYTFNEVRRHLEDGTNPQDYGMTAHNFKFFPIQLCQIVTLLESETPSVQANSRISREKLNQIRGLYSNTIPNQDDGGVSTASNNDRAHENSDAEYLELLNRLLSPHDTDTSPVEGGEVMWMNVKPGSEPIVTVSNVRTLLNSKGECVPLTAPKTPISLPAVSNDIAQPGALFEVKRRESSNGNTLVLPCALDRSVSSISFVDAAGKEIQPLLDSGTLTQDRLGFIHVKLPENCQSIKYRIIPRTHRQIDGQPPPATLGQKIAQLHTSQKTEAMQIIDASTFLRERFLLDASNPSKKDKEQASVETLDGLMLKCFPITSALTDEQKLYQTLVKSSQSIQEKVNLVLNHHINGTTIYTTRDSLRNYVRKQASFFDGQHQIGVKGNYTEIATYICNELRAFNIRALLADTHIVMSNGEQKNLSPYRKINTVVIYFDESNNPHILDPRYFIRREPDVADDLLIEDLNGDVVKNVTSRQKSEAAGKEPDSKKLLDEIEKLILQGGVYKGSAPPPSNAAACSLHGSAGSYAFTPPRFKQTDNIDFGKLAISILLKMNEFRRNFRTVLHRGTLNEFVSLFSQANELKEYLLVFDRDSSGGSSSYQNAWKLREAMLRHDDTGQDIPELLTYLGTSAYKGELKDYLIYDHSPHADELRQQYRAWFVQKRNFYRRSDNYLPDFEREIQEEVVYKPEHLAKWKTINLIRALRERLNDHETDYRLLNELLRRRNSATEIEVAAIDDILKKRLVREWQIRSSYYNKDGIKLLSEYEEPDIFNRYYADLVLSFRNGHGEDDPWVHHEKAKRQNWILNDKGTAHSRERLKELFLCYIRSERIDTLIKDFFEENEGSTINSKLLRLKLQLGIPLKDLLSDEEAIAFLRRHYQLNLEDLSYFKSDSGRLDRACFKNELSAEVDGVARQAIAFLEIIDSPLISRIPVMEETQAWERFQRRRLSLSTEQIVKKIIAWTIDSSESLRYLNPWERARKEKEREVGDEVRARLAPQLSRASNFVAFQLLHIAVARVFSIAEQREMMCSNPKFKSLLVTANRDQWNKEPPPLDPPISKESLVRKKLANLFLKAVAKENCDVMETFPNLQWRDSDTQLVNPKEKLEKLLNANKFLIEMLLKTPDKWGEEITLDGLFDRKEVIDLCKAHPYLGPIVSYKEALNEPFLCRFTEYNRDDLFKDAIGEQRFEHLRNDVRAHLKSNPSILPSIISYHDSSTKHLRELLDGHSKTKSVLEACRLVLSDHEIAEILLTNPVFNEAVIALWSPEMFTSAKDVALPEIIKLAKEQYSAQLELLVKKFEPDEESQEAARELRGYIMNRAISLVRRHKDIEQGLRVNFFIFANRREHYIYSLRELLRQNVSNVDFKEKLLKIVADHHENLTQRAAVKYWINRCKSIDSLKAFILLNVSDSSFGLGKLGITSESLSNIEGSRPFLSPQSSLPTVNVDTSNMAELFRSLSRFVPVDYSHGKLIQAVNTDDMAMKHELPVFRHERHQVSLRASGLPTHQMLRRAFTAPFPSSIYRYSEIPALRAPSRTDAGMKNKTAGFSRDEFDRIAEYTPGDDIRFINWKATYKGDKVLVNRYSSLENEPEPITFVFPLNFVGTLKSHELEASIFNFSLLIRKMHEQIRNREKVGMVITHNGSVLYDLPWRETVRLFRSTTSDQYGTRPSYFDLVLQCIHLATLEYDIPFREELPISYRLWLPRNQARGGRIVAVGYTEDSLQESMHLFEGWHRAGIQTFKGSFTHLKTGKT